MCSALRVLRLGSCVPRPSQKENERERKTIRKRPGPCQTVRLPPIRSLVYRVVLFFQSSCQTFCAPFLFSPVGLSFLPGFEIGSPGTVLPT